MLWISFLCLFSLTRTFSSMLIKVARMYIIILFLILAKSLQCSVQCYIHYDLFQPCCWEGHCSLPCVNTEYCLLYSFCMVLSPIPLVVPSHWCSDLYLTDYSWKTLCRSLPEQLMSLLNSLNSCCLCLSQFRHFPVSSSVPLPCVWLANSVNMVSWAIMELAFFVFHLSQISSLFYFFLTYPVYL